MNVPARAGGACGRAAPGREGEDARERAKKFATIGSHPGSLHPPASDLDIPTA